MTKIFFWAALVLVSFSLATVMKSSASVVGPAEWRVQAPAARHSLNLPVLCEAYDHEVGFARIALGAMALLVVFFPFRRRQLWGWLALAALLGVYFLPVFVLPHPFPRWTMVAEGVREAWSGRGVLSQLLLPWSATARGQVAVGPTLGVLADFFFPSLMLLGLLLSLPSFVRGKRSPTSARAQQPSTGVGVPVEPGLAKGSGAFSASVVLVCISLANLAASGTWMVNYVQWDVRMAAARHAPGLHFLCELQVHEAGYARIAGAGVGLLIVCMAYRRRECWSWVSLAALAAAYLPPLFALPLPFKTWIAFAAGLQRPGLLWPMLSDLLLPALMLIGLLLSLPSFIGWGLAAPRRLR